jgi:hypothetical protein
VRLAVPHVLAQHGDRLGVGVGVELVATLDEDSLELFVCLSAWKRCQPCCQESLQFVMIPSVKSASDPSQYDQVFRLTVDQGEFGLTARDVRVTVQNRRHTVCRPPGVSHRRLAEESLVHVDLGTGRGVAGTILQLLGQGSLKALCNVFAERSDLADFFEKDDGASGRVAVDSDTFMFSSDSRDSAGVNPTRGGNTHQQSHIHGIRDERDRCTRRHRRTCGPSR